MWSRKSVVFVGSSALVITLAFGLVACSSKPSQALLDEFKSSDNKLEPPMVLVWLRNTAAAQDGGAAPLMGILSTRFGFTHPQGAPRTFKSPSLPGVSFQEKEDKGSVLIIPDYHREMVIESAEDPETGSAREIAGMEGSNKDEAKKLQEAFLGNVELIRKDKGYKRAWLVRYRNKEFSNLPDDSPFWDLVAQVRSDRAFMVATGVQPSAGLLVTKKFWETHGKTSTKDALERSVAIVFEGGDGKIAKVEGWQAFFPN